jgi:hypothetical protein
MKNKIKFLQLVLILFFSFNTHSQVTVSVQNLQYTNNGQPASYPSNCGNIDLASSTSTSVNLGINLSKPSGQVVGLSDLRVYTQKSSSDTRVERSWVQIQESFWSTSQPNTYSSTSSFTINSSEFNVSGGTLFVVFKSSGGIEYQTSCSFTITKTPPPSFSLSPSALSLACGDISQRTFSVTPANIPAGANVSYIWSHPGWSLVSSTATSRTLVPTSGTITPSNVTITPRINNVSQPVLTSIISRSPLVNNTSISGADVVCLGNNTFNLLNLGQNNSVSWSINSAGVASISSSNQSNVIINATASGAVEIIATISNPCQQTNVIRKNIWVGTPLISDIAVLDMNSFPSTTPYIAPSSSSDCSTIGLQLNLTQSLNQISEIQWERLSQGVFWSRDYGSNGTKDIKVFIYPQGNMNFEYRVRLRNFCGWSDWFEYNYNIESCSYDYSPPVNGIEGENFILSPVPVTNGLLQVGLTNNAPWFIIGGDSGGSSNPSLDPGTGVQYVPASVIVNVSIYNQIGLLVMNLPNRTIPSSIDLNALPAGTYIINFEYQGQIESHTFVKN